MRKASTRLPEQGTQTPSPAPDLIPAETENQPRTHISIGTANGGTRILAISAELRVFQHPRDFSPIGLCRCCQTLSHH
jgi:hypothetical protein